jgi:hypothetical protein
MVTEHQKRVILILRGSMTTAALAAHLGVTVGVVAGVCFRADHGTSNKIRLGRNPRQRSRFVNPDDTEISP